MDIGLEPDGSVRSLSTRDAVTAIAAGHEGHRRRAPFASNALVAAGNAQGLNAR